MSEADDLYTRTLGVIISGFGSMSNFRALADKAVVHYSAEHESEAEALAVQLFNNPYLSRIKAVKPDDMDDKEVIELIANSLKDAAEKNHTSYVDAASLIFAHSLIDGAAHNLCQVIFLKDYTVWINDIDERKVAIKDIRDVGAEEAVRTKVREYVEVHLGKQPLLTKLDRLYSKCQPEQEKGFKPDLDRLKRIDDDRHGLAHGHLRISEYTIRDDTLFYLNGCCNYYCQMVAQRYLLKINYPLLASEMGKKT